MRTASRHFDRQALPIFRRANDIYIACLPRPHFIYIFFTPRDILFSKEVIAVARLSAYFSLENAAGKHDAALLKRELDTLTGVTSVSVSGGGCLAVDYDTSGVRQEQILQKIQELGFHLRDGGE